jgi:hypothetical protein
VGVEPHVVGVAEHDLQPGVDPVRHQEPPPIAARTAAARRFRRRCRMLTRSAMA